MAEDLLVYLASLWGQGCDQLEGIRWPLANNKRCLQLSACFTFQAQDRALGGGSSEVELIIDTSDGSWSVRLATEEIEPAKVAGIDGSGFVIANEHVRHSGYFLYEDRKE